MNDTETLIFSKIDVTKLPLIQKLAEIRKMCEVIAKDKSGYGYKYVSAPEILANVTAGMDNYHVSLLPSIGEANVEPDRYTTKQVTKDGKIIEKLNSEMVFTGRMTYTWVNDDDPSDKIEVPWFIAGSQSDPAQAMGSAMTYGLRYFLLQYFQVATPEDDPDEWRGKQQAAKEEAEKEITQKIIEQINDLVNTRLTSKPDDRDFVITATKKYAREKGKPSANYKNIKSAEDAAKLLEELREKFSDIQK